LKETSWTKSFRRIVAQCDAAFGADGLFSHNEVHSSCFHLSTERSESRCDRKNEEYSQDGGGNRSSLNLNFRFLVGFSGIRRAAKHQPPNTKLQRSSKSQ